MDIIVQKYGGTSLENIDKIGLVAAKIALAAKKGCHLVIVLSAMAGETDKLQAMADALSARPDARALDVLLSTGEQVTIALLCIALSDLGVKACSFTGHQVPIVTDDVHNKAKIVEIEKQKIQHALDNNNVVVVAGFQGTDINGNITTLGRGGSDTTAVALAAALNAKECQIYSDVDGVYTADPKVVEKASLLKDITVDEMLELSSLGAKVLQIRAVELAGRFKVPVRVLNTCKEGSGTLIALEGNKTNSGLISGIAFNRDEAKLTILGVPDKPGIASRILGVVSAAHIDVDMIIQNAAADGTTDFTFTVHRNDFKHAIDIVNAVATRLSARAVQGDTDIAKISLVGVGMRAYTGIASKMFDVFAQQSINIQLISTSEIKVSVVVEEKHLELGVRALHTAFGLDCQPIREKMVG